METLNLFSGGIMIPVVATGGAGFRAEIPDF